MSAGCERSIFEPVCNFVLESNPPTSGRNLHLSTTTGVSSGAGGNTHTAFVSLSPSIVEELQNCYKVSSFSNTTNTSPSSLLGGGVGHDTERAGVMSSSSPDNNRFYTPQTNVSTSGPSLPSMSPATARIEEEALRRHVCKICWKSFKRRDHLVEHVRTHTGEKPYMCQICSKSFAKKSNLNAHVKSHAYVINQNLK